MVSDWLLFLFCFFRLCYLGLFIEMHMWPCLGNIQDSAKVTVTWSSGARESFAAIAPWVRDECGGLGRGEYVPAPLIKESLMRGIVLAIEGVWGVMLAHDFDEHEHEHEHRHHHRHHNHHHHHHNHHQLSSSDAATWWENSTGQSSAPSPMCLHDKSEMDIFPVQQYRNEKQKRLNPH